MLGLNAAEHWTSQQRALDTVSKCIRAVHLKVHKGRGADCRVVLTLRMQPCEIGWNAPPSAIAQPDSRGPCIPCTWHLQAWSPLGPTVCGDLHESVSMTEHLIAQVAALREHA